MSTVAVLDVLIGADVSGLNSGLNQAQGKVDSFASKAGKTLIGLGGSLTALTSPLLIFGATGVSVASEFENSMAEISARTGLVGDDLQDISDFALQMGADTSFSAQQASDAFLQLLSSGQSAEQAIATLPAVLDLAAASGSDLGATADSLTDIMAAFGLETADAAYVADQLAAASGASSASIEDLSAAFANVGGVAKNFGLDVETTAAVLAIFAENGTKGAEAGTQLKSMLLNFTSDTAQTAFDELGVSLYDAQGNMRDFETVITELDASLDQLPIEEQNTLMLDLGGSYGIVGLSALRGSISIDKMEESMMSAASASDVADARMNTFSGRVDSLRGSIETLQIRAFTPLMEDSLSPMVIILTDVVNGITDFAAANPGLTQTIVNMGVAATIAGPVLIGIGGALVALASPAILAGAALGAVAAGVIGLVSAVNSGQINLEQIGTQISAGLAQIQIGDTNLATLAENVRANIITALSGITINGSDLESLSSAITTSLSGITVSIDDLSGLPETIATTISDSFAGTTIDTAPIATWANDNMNTIVDTIVGVAGIVFGGPVGMTIGAAKLVATAIETDFLGIGTFLNTSGISASVETAFGTIKDLISGLVDSVFGGGGQEDVVVGPANFDFTGMTESLAAADASGGGASKFIADITMALDGIIKIASGIGEDVIKGVTDLGKGIGDFVSGIAGAETQGLYDFIRPFAAVIGFITGAALSLSGFAAGTVLSAVGDTLGDFGEAIGDVITIFSRLGEGDVGGAAEAFLSAIGNFVEGIVSFPASIADDLITALEELTGIQMPSVDEGFAGWTSAFSDGWQILQIVVDKIMRGLDRFVIDAKIKVLDFVSGFRQIILDASASLPGGAIDIAPTIGVSLDELNTARLDYDVADGIEKLLRQELADGGPIDLGLGYASEIIYHGEGIADKMSVTGVDAVKDAISVGLTNLDEGGLSQLIPLALELDIQDEDLRLQLETTLRDSFIYGDSAISDLLIPLALDLGIDVEAVRADAQQQVTDAVAGADYTTTVTDPVTVSVLTATPDVSAVDAAVTTAIETGDYSATVTAQVAVNAVVSFAQDVNSLIVGGLQDIQTGIADIATPPADVPGAATGAEILGEGLLYVHAGERVLTAAENKGYGPASIAPPPAPSSGSSSGQGRGGDTWNVSSFGQSSFELLEMIKRERAHAAL